MNEQALRGLYEAGPDGQKPLPELKVSCCVRLFATVAGVALKQTYRNDSTGTVELLYVFPVDEAAAVSGFQARIGGRVIDGVVKKKDEAAAQYDDAIAAGHGAYYLEQAGSSDLLSMRLGNVESGAVVVIKICYSFVCDTDGEQVTFKLPTTIKERYSPAGEKLKEVAHEPVFSTGLRSSLEVRVDVYASGEIYEITSPTHGLRVQANAGNKRFATVTLDESKVGLDQDVIMRIRREAPHSPSVCLVKAGLPNSSPAVMLTFLPQFEADEVLSSECIFVVDCSGSMAETDRKGNSAIGYCRTALQVFLRSLPESCSFNIVKFGSSFEELFPSSRPYNAESLQAATAYVDALDANLGGTELLAPLESVLKSQPCAEGTPRHMFILTDGAVTNTKDVIQLVRMNAHTTRVCTFGVGEGVGEHLVRGVARAGLGEASFIQFGDQIAATVVEQLTKALHPCLELPSVDWGSLEVVQQSPPSVRLPPVYNNALYTVYALLAPGSPCYSKVHLNGRLMGKFVSFCADVSPLPCSFEDEDIGCALQQVVVQRFMRDAEEGMADDAVSTITDWSLRFQIVSEQTAFVAVEERLEPVDGAMAIVKVPLSSLRRGPLFPDTYASYGDEDGVLEVYGIPESGCLMMDDEDEYAEAYESMAYQGDPSIDQWHVNGSSHSKVATTDDDQCSIDDLSGGVQQRALSAAVEGIIKLQNADGSWALTVALGDALGLSYEELLGSKPSFLNHVLTADHLWATAIALAYLDQLDAKQRSVFLLLAKKARRWMSRQPAVHTDDLTAAAESAMRTLSTTGHLPRVSEKLRQAEFGRFQ